MGGSYLGNTVNCEDTSLNSIPGNCSCVVPGADDDLCVHYFEELDFSSFDISGAEEIDDGLELDELVTDLSQELIFHDVDENENIFDGNGSDDSESLSNDPDSTEGLPSDGVSPSLEGEKLTDTAENKSEDVLTKSSISNNVSPALRLQYYTVQAPFGYSTSISSHSIFAYVFWEIPFSFNYVTLMHTKTI